MRVFPNPNNSQLLTPTSPHPTRYKHIATFIQQATLCVLFSKVFREIGSTFNLESPRSRLDYIWFALACLVSALISFVLYFLLIPAKLFILAITCPCCRKTEEISPPAEASKVFKPLTEIQSEFVIGIQTEILKKVADEFKTNMLAEILRLAPPPSLFLNSLATTSYSKSSHIYKKLPNLIDNLNCWDKGWGIIINYLTTELLDPHPHPDVQTFSIMVYHLTLALEDPDIPREKKRATLKEISSYAEMCRPTWGEAIFRAVNNLYSTRDSGRDQILLWVQMFKENLLVQQQLVDHQEEWHQINGLKRIYGEDLGLITDHLHENLSNLTLRQTSTLPENTLIYTELKNSFQIAYRDSCSELIQYVYDAFLKSKAEIQAQIHNFLLEEVANIINLPETGAHIDLVVDAFYNDNYELKREGIIYLLYIMEIIVPKNT
ncbi:DUF1548 domain-containing protein [Chlamydia sp. 12-01]|uniref:DUF1548 domain-containing protein n=1 Tax=Chlamydia sp. 12-01 TaxID=3002742 RepID=UPI0035D45F62